MRCEQLDLGYIDGMLLLPLIIEHTIGAVVALAAAATAPQQGACCVPVLAGVPTWHGAARISQKCPMCPPFYHAADERSPLCGHTHDSLMALNAEVVVTFEGTTEVGLWLC